MIVCTRCDHEIKHGDEYKIAYGKIWCVECAWELEDAGNFGMTYTLINKSEGSQT